jgi:hypothetical protein
VLVTRELVVDSGFAAARARLVRIMDGGGLDGGSRDAYEGALTRLIRVGPFGGIPGISKLVQVRFLGPVKRDGAKTIWLRWEATGPVSGLFPALDADLSLTAEGQDKTRITLAGSYRPPFGHLGAGLDRVIMRRVASATFSSLLRSVANVLAEPGQIPTPPQEDSTGADPPPPEHEAT